MSYMLRSHSHVYMLLLLMPWQLVELDSLAVYWNSCTESYMSYDKAQMLVRPLCVTQQLCIVTDQIIHT